MPLHRIYCNISMQSRDKVPLSVIRRAIAEAIRKEIRTSDSDDAFSLIISDSVTVGRCTSVSDSSQKDTPPNE